MDVILMPGDFAQDAGNNEIGSFDAVCSFFYRLSRRQESTDNCFMVHGQSLAKRMAQMFLTHFSPETTFDIDLLNEEQCESVRTALIEAGCEVVKYDRKNRLNVVAPSH
jgi:hypothetical protein